MMKKHNVHKYERYTYDTGHVILRCVLPNCNHYIAKDLASNKLAICHRCGEEFQLDKKLVELHKPHCYDCTRDGSNQFIKGKARPVVDHSALDVLLGKIPKNE